MAQADEAAMRKAADEALALVAQSGSIMVRTQTEYLTAAGILKTVKTKAAELDTLRKSMTRPLDEAKKRIMDFFRAPTEALDRMERTVKDAMVAFDREQERLRLAEEERLHKLREAEEARLAAATASAAAAGDLDALDSAIEQQQMAASAPIPVVSSATPQVAGISKRTVWRWRLVDLSRVPRDYLVLNETMVWELVRASGGAIQIPGIEVFSESVLGSGRW